MGHDTDFRRLRAISQDNSARIQKLNEELRKLKECVDHEASKKTGTKRTQSTKPNTKT